MQIVSGLFDRMVLQRTWRGECDTRIVGTCRLNGPVLATVCRGGKKLHGFESAVIGRAVGGRFTARLRGLSTGGSYSITLEICDKTGARERLQLSGVLVGDVWILAGQSNMQGCGNRADAAKPHQWVRAFYMDDRWDVARDSIHNLWNAVDPVHGGKPDGKDPGGKGVGPGVAFGKEMLRRTGVSQGLIACAHGGTSMLQWDPARRTHGGKSLYGAMLRRFHKNGARVAGVLWYQGESDTGPAAAPWHTRRMRHFVCSLRRDLGNPRVPVVLAQLGPYAGDNMEAPGWNSIQDQQRRLSETLPNVYVVPTIDLELDDAIHISGASQNVLGRRMAEAMLHLVSHGEMGRAPIALEAVSLDRKEPDGMVRIIVAFKNVIGSLQAGGRPQGFAVCSAEGPSPCIYRTEIHGSRAVLRTRRQPLYFACRTLHYGYGLMPACNITDASGWPLPVFGPVPLGKPRLATPFINRMEVSKLMPGAGKLHGLDYPSDPESLGFQWRTSPWEFMDHHEVIEAHGGDAVVYFRCRFRCCEPMKLAMLLGYDGPVKAWIDRRCVLHDPTGTNPAVMDKRAVRFEAAAGDHEALIALGTNDGKAWGIYLRFERLGVSRQRLQSPEPKPPLPELLP